MFKRVLIANRGLIQANCVRAIKELGATAVTVFEEEDRESAGVRNADEAYKLKTTPGGVRPYLDIEQMVQMAVDLKVDAVHPGYGFLAQNVEFARQLERRRITLIGPRTGDIGNLTNKAVVKEAAHKAGLPVLPGSSAFSEFGELQASAKKLKFPLIMKAAHGYGGIGMRIVKSPSELARAFQSMHGICSKYLMNSPEIYLEEYLENARLISFPVLRDEKGRTLVFPEMECSLQRRFTKLLVETPAPRFSPDLRSRLESEVRVLCERLNIFGFASVEFLLKDDQPYFLEINYYIEPSHTATTLLCGVDMLKEQARLVSGEALRQRMISGSPDRHVMCAYIFAEDPLKNFEPSPGLVDRLYLPFGVFMQTSIFSGARISPFYDPMVAKLLVRGLSREEAIRKLDIALEEFFVEGVKTNIPLMRGILHSKAFAESRMSGEFLSEPKDRETLVNLLKSDEDFEQAALVATLSLHRDGDTLKRMQNLSEENSNYSFLGAAARWLRPRKPRRRL
jgi:acetyl/propionyl-CoA carboxylase alpha subunit